MKNALPWLLVIVAIAAVIYQQSIITALQSRQQKELSALKNSLSSISPSPQPRRDQTLITVVAPPSLPTQPASSGSNSSPSDDIAPVTPQSAEEVETEKEASFAAETVDRDWSRATAPVATRMVTDLLPSGSSVRNVECRSTMCRVETVHRTVDDFRRFGRAAFSQKGFDWRAPVSLALEQQPNGDVMGVLFFSREPEQMRRYPRAVAD